jgi:sugar lactone lactonase YvrE
MILTHTHSISGKGQQPDQFRRLLAGIAVDSQDRLLAVGDQEVKQFSADGVFEQHFSLPSPGWSIAVDAETVWVGLSHEIVQFDFDGSVQRRIEDKPRLGRVTGLAVSGGTLLAADATNRTIHLFQDGKWLREVGRDVNTRGFMLPNGVLDLALDAGRESFVVAHPQKHRVERYNMQGKLTDKFGRFGMQDPADFAGCCNPTNITAARNGLLAVSEKAPPRVKIYTSAGRFLGQSADGIFDDNTKNIDLATDRRGRLYATDPARCTIEVFELAASTD